MTQDTDAGTPVDDKKARILIADDSKIVRVTASKILATQFDVVLAEDGEEAWEKICQDTSIQVVFTDLGMPRLDGYGLIQRIRQAEDEGIRNQPVIVITGAGNGSPATVILNALMRSHRRLASTITPSALAIGSTIKNFSTP